jgi:hypothetical protein
MSAEYQDWAGSGMRVSDADREATAAELREHYAAGRLTLDELNERVNKAFAATTRGDLSTIMHDLPSLRPGTTPPATGQPSSGAGWSGQGWGRQDGARGPGRAVGSLITTLVAVCVLAWFGIMAAWGLGGGGSRPVAIALLLAAVALLRRLFFGRRRAGRPRRASARRGRPHRRF